METVLLLTEILKLFNRFFDNLETRILKLENADQLLKGELMGIKEQVAQLTQRTNELQTVLGNETAELKTAIDKLFAQIKDLQGIDIGPQIAVINDSINRIGSLSDLTIEPDTEVPSTPSGLTAVSPNATSVDLSWSASTDNVAVESYEIFQDGVSITSSPSPNFKVTGLNPGTTYVFSLRAKDKAGNFSPVTAGVSVTTLT